MTIYIQKNSRIRLWFIDKNILNQVLILTFYFLLLGNNAATMWESSIISGTMDFITLWGRNTNYSKSFVCHYPYKILVLFFIVSAEMLKESHFNNISPFFDGLVNFILAIFGFLFLCLFIIFEACQICVLSTYIIKPRLLNFNRNMYIVSDALLALSEHLFSLIT